MAANAEAWLGLAVQIPIVGIFVWFSLQLISYFLKSIDERDKQWREFLKQQADTTNVQMTQQREANNAAIASMAARFADEIRALGKEVAELRGSR